MEELRLSVCHYFLLLVAQPYLLLVRKRASMFSSENQKITLYCALQNTK